MRCRSLKSWLFNANLAMLANYGHWTVINLGLYVKSVADLSRICAFKNYFKGSSLFAHKRGK